MNVTKKTMKDAVEAVANQLAVRDGKITTLDLKNELRVVHPHVIWNQYQTGVTLGVSDLFHELVRDGKFRSIKDNGTYQTYVPTQNVGAQLQGALQKQSQRMNNVGFSASKGVTVKASDAVTVGKSTQRLGNASTTTVKKASKAVAKAVETPTGTTSRAKAKQLMEANKGRFFTVTFVNKEGELRTMNAQYVKNQKPSELGYVLVKEASKMRAKDKDQIRNVNLQTLKTIKIGGQLLKVK